MLGVKLIDRHADYNTIELILEPLYGKLPLRVSKTVYPDDRASHNEVFTNVKEQLKPVEQ